MFADLGSEGIECVKEKRGLLLRRPDPAQQEGDDGTDEISAGALVRTFFHEPQVDGLAHRLLSISVFAVLL